MRVVIVLVSFSNGLSRTSSASKSSVGIGVLTDEAGNVNAGSSDRLQFTTWSNGGFHELYGQTGVADGQWHHVAITYDGSQKVIYIDGEPDASVAYSAPIDASDVPLTLGRNRQYTVGEYDGLLDDIRIYRRVLTGAEVRAIRDEIP